MAYQYRFVDVLARGLENAANRAERAEAARVQEKQFGEQMKMQQAELSQRQDEFDALQKLREKADERAALAQEEETKYRKLNYELQVDKAIQDMIQFDIEQDNAKEMLDARLQNALEIAKLGTGDTTEMIDVSTLPEGLQEALNLPEGTTTVSAKVLPIYNSLMSTLNRVASVDPEGLSEVSDKTLVDMNAFNSKLLEMNPTTAIALGMGPQDINVIGQNLQFISAEQNRRAQAIKTASEAQKARDQQAQGQQQVATDTLTTQLR